MEHLDRQILAALGAASRARRVTGPAPGDPLADGLGEARPAERMDGGHALETVELVEGTGLAAATALLLGRKVHPAKKNEFRGRAMATT